MTVTVVKSKGAEGGEGVGVTVSVTVVNPEGAEGGEGGAPICASLSRLITEMPVTSGLHIC